LEEGVEEEGREDDQGEEEEEEDEDEAEDDFFVSEKLPAHLLTQKRDPSQLPLSVGGNGWVMYKHPSYGIYYYNELTNDSTYERPGEWVENKHGFAKRRTGEEEEEVKGEEEEEEEEAGLGEEIGGGGFTGLFSKPAPTDGLEAEVLAEDAKWGRLLDPDTKMQYFYNSSTGESQYERPDDYTTSDDPFKVARGGGGGSKGDDGEEELDILSSHRSNHNMVETVKDRRGGAWGRYVDPETKVEYFYNEVTGESQYERPDNFETGRDAFRAVRGGIESKGNEGGGGEAEDKPDVDILSSMRSTHSLMETLAGNWVKYEDEEHGAYYYNNRTQESTYDRPEGMETSRNPFDGVREDGGISLVPRKGEKGIERGNNGWEKFKDESSGADYYYNSGTDVSQYERPIGFETIRGGGGKAVEEKPDVDILSSRRSAIEEPKEVLNGGWEKYQVSCDEQSESRIWLG